MSLLWVLPFVALGQIEIKDGDREVRLSLSEGLTFKTATKQVTLSGAGLKAISDGGRAFTGIAQDQEHVCTDGENIDVGGTGNDVVLKGRCGEVTVAGLSNTVSLESAAAIDVSGKNNNVTWEKGEPKLTKSGSGNHAVKVR